MSPNIREDLREATIQELEARTVSPEGSVTVGDLTLAERDVKYPRNGRSGMETYYPKHDPKHVTKAWVINLTWVLECPHYFDTDKVCVDVNTGSQLSAIPDTQLVRLATLLADEKEAANKVARDLIARLKS